MQNEHNTKRSSKGRMHFRRQSINAHTCPRSVSIHEIDSFAGESGQQMHPRASQYLTRGQDNHPPGGEETDHRVHRTVEHDDKNTLILRRSHEARSRVCCKSFFAARLANISTYVHDRRAAISPRSHVHPRSCPRQ